MWEGVTPVSDHYDPPLSESPVVVGAVVLNAGPNDVELRAWTTFPVATGASPNITLELRVGHTRSVCGCLVRVKMLDTESGQPKSGPGFAAVAWRTIAP
jgi:hypothetical protein